MSEDSPELTRSKEVALKLSILEGHLESDRERWEKYASDCIRACTRYIRETGEGSDEFRTLFSGLAEEKGRLMWSKEGEVKLAERMAITEALIDLSKLGVELPEFSIRKENNNE